MNNFSVESFSNQTVLNLNEFKHKSEKTWHNENEICSSSQSESFKSKNKQYSKSCLNWSNSPVSNQTREVLIVKDLKHKADLREIKIPRFIGNNHAADKRIHKYPSLNDIKVSSNYNDNYVEPNIPKLEKQLYLKTIQNKRLENELNEKLQELNTLETEILHKNEDYHKSNKLGQELDRDIENLKALIDSKHEIYVQNTIALKCLEDLHSQKEDELKTLCLQVELFNIRIKEAC